MALVLTSAPTAEPVTVAQAKEHLRVDGTIEDVLITSLIITSRLHVEQALGLALLTQGWKLILDKWPNDNKVGLPMRPLQSVNSVNVLDAEAAPTLMDPQNYIVDTASEPPRLVAKGPGMPRPGRTVNGIEIDFTAGFGPAATDVPAPIRQAVLLLVAHWFEHRDPIEIGSSSVAIPGSVSRLLKPYVMARL